ncbi:hypothetical protein B9Z55_028051 [Caenorhabditis nigoni]|nr:hypothetical protein B9Z55_028051 [Caenorhabditis nigoni]
MKLEKSDFRDETLGLEETRDKRVAMIATDLFLESRTPGAKKYTPHPDIGGYHFDLDNGDLGSIFFYSNAGMPSTDIGIIVWRPDT